VVGGITVGVPFQAVYEIHPRAGLAVPLGNEVLMRAIHANGLNVLDSLQTAHYPQ
jgi:hypothetical protein